MLSGVSFISAERSQNPPPRTCSLVHVMKEHPDAIRESAQDVEQARHLLDKLLSDCNLHGEKNKDSESEKVFSDDIFESYARMIRWVEQLSVLLQDAQADQMESKTALMLAESNLQMALANNEMLEDALRQAGPNVKDIGWRRLSERERLRQAAKEDEELENTSETEEYSSPIHKPHSTPPPSQTQLVPSHHLPSSSLRFFSFPSLSRSTPPLNGLSSQSQSLASSEFSTGAQSSRPSSPASSRPTAREKELSILLDKEKEALKSVSAAKLALENELETLSQALFEEANKMVSTSNRKLAEIEEELHIVMEEREALRSALRVVENENGTLRAKHSISEDAYDGESDKLSEYHAAGNERPYDALSANYLHLDKSSPLADPVSFITISPVDSDIHASLWKSDIQFHSEVAGSPCNNELSQRDEAPAGVTYDSPTRSVVRWNIIPHTPHSRMAVKDEFEKAMLRMERLIEDVEGNTQHHEQGE